MRPQPHADAPLSHPCHARFSERKGTPLFDTRLPPDTVPAILDHVAEGVGTRRTALLVGIHRDIVTRYFRAAGDHAHLLHDEWVAFPPTADEVRFDEKWSFVARTERNREPDESMAGDGWDHVALHPHSRLVVALVVGKWTAEATRELAADFRARTSGPSAGDPPTRPRRQPVPVRNSPMNRFRACGSTGLTRWWSNPAAAVLRRSSSCPHPVRATSSMPLPHGCSRMRRHAS